jgi:hypothetical protein
MDFQASIQLLNIPPGTIPALDAACALIGNASWFCGVNTTAFAIVPNMPAGAQATYNWSLVSGSAPWPSRAVRSLQAGWWGPIMHPPACLDAAHRQYSF